MVGSGGLLSSCFCRLGLNEVHADVFELVRHLVDSILCTQWRTVAKSHDPVSWAIGRQHELNLVMPKVNLANIVRCPAGQLASVHTDMVACIEAGSEIASMLFSSSVGSVMEDAVKKAMNEVLADFMKKSDKEVTKEQCDTVLAAMLEKVDGLGSGHTHTHRTHAHKTFFINCVCVCVWVWEVGSGVGVHGLGWGCAFLQASLIVSRRIAKWRWTTATLPSRTLPCHPSTTKPHCGYPHV